MEKNEDKQDVLQEKQHTTERNEKLKPGARIIPILFIIFAIVFLVESIFIYRKDPSIEGSATFPLLVSLLMVLLGIIDFLQKMRKQSENYNKPIISQIRAILQYLLPIKALVFLILAIGYYLMLKSGVGFIVSTLIFLISSMSYLIRKSFWKNLTYTIICVAVLYVIFKIIFKVFLP